jgi:xyloglucan-specific exo-beta-1,4-glucanase
MLKHEPIVRVNGTVSPYMTASRFTPTGDLSRTAFFPLFFALTCAACGSNEASHTSTGMAGTAGVVGSAGSAQGGAATGGGNGNASGAGAGASTSTGGFLGAGGSLGASGSSGASGATGMASGPNPNGPYRWSTVALGGGGFVSAVVASLSEKNVFFARTDVGGLYRWNEAGGNWIPLTNFVSDAEVGFLGVESVAVDPESPGKIYALVGTDYFNGGKTAILRSTDDGDHFTVTEVTAQFKAHGNGMGRQNGERLAVDPNLGSVLFCGTRRNGLFKSTDSGATWTAVAALPVTTTANDNGISLVLFDKSSGAVGTATPRIFAGVSRLGDTNFYVSTNAGVSWSAVAGAPATTQMPQRAAIATNGTLYVSYANGAGPNGNGGTEPMSAGAIWKYDLQKATWAEVTPMGVTSAFSGISVDAANPNHLVATTINTYVKQPWGYGDRIYVSTDGGASWADPIGAGTVTMNPNGMPWIVNHAIHWAGTATFDPNDSDRVFVTSGNGVFATSNLSAAASTWSFVAKGLEETVPLEAVSIPSMSFGVVVGDYDGFITSDVTTSPPGGIYDPAMGSTGALALAGSKPSVLVRAATKIFRTSDGGANWTEVPRPNTQMNGLVALSADGGVLIWTPDTSTTAYRTANVGVAWAAVTGISFNGPVIGDSVNSAKFYAYDANAGGFFVSTDGGASFAQASSAGTGGASKLRAVPGVEGDVWIPLNGGGLTRTTNSGQSFSKISGVSVCNAVGFGQAAAGQAFPTVFIWGSAGGGATGLYRSTDSGATWERINDDQDQFGGPGNGQFVVGDMNVYGRVYMSTVGLGTVYGEPN